MSIDPAAFTRTDSISTPLLPPKPPTSANTSKPLKAVNTAQRLDYEATCTNLKNAIGDRWTGYKEALCFYLMGVYSEADFVQKLEKAVQGDVTAQSYHDSLLGLIYANTTRELPDNPVASWVSANDKPAVVPKPVSGDAAEQRLKTEVMQLPARDRRRLKAIVDHTQATSADTNSMPPNPLEEYHQAKQIRLPEHVPASAGGLNKTNWEIEIRKRYAQPLASETLEFPDQDSILARMTPICYEEAIPSGTSPACAELVAVATETFVKDALSVIFSRTRSNGPSANGGIMTKKYRKQLQAEEEGTLRGEVQRNSTNGLLPVEVKEAQGRRPIGMADVRLAIQIGGGSLLGQMPLVQERIAGGWVESEDVEEIDIDVVDVEGKYGIGSMMNGNGVGGRTEDDIMDIDEDDYGWEGAKQSDRKQLGVLLDGLLAGS